MKPQDFADLQATTNLYVLSVKVKALKAALNAEQLEIYNQAIEAEKQLHFSQWKSILTPLEFDAFVKLFDE